MPQAKNDQSNPFAGGEPMEDDNEPFADLSFDTPAEKTDEEIAAEAAKAEAKAALLKDESKEEDKKVEKTEAELAQEEADAAEALEADRKAKEAEEAAKKTGKKQPMVPKSRLDEVLAKNKILAQERDEARAAAAPKVEEGKEEKAFDFDAREADYMQAVLDGEKEKALAIRKEIRAAERDELAAAARTDSVEVDDNAAMARAAAAIEENFPQFVRGHADYNEEATNRVVSMRDALINSGVGKVQALNEAVEFVVQKYGFDVPLEAPKQKDNVVDLEAKRKKDTKDKVEVLKKQPKDMPGEGERTRTQSEIDLDELSEAEFDALPEATKKRLRGDSM